MRARIVARNWPLQTFDDDHSTLDWSVEGTTAGGRAFTVEHHLYEPRMGDGPNPQIDRLVWHCPALRSSSLVFYLAQRTGMEFARTGAGSLAINGAKAAASGLSNAAGLGGDTSRADDFLDLIRNGKNVAAAGLGERWMALTRDPGLAQRVFDAELCRIVRTLPREKQFHRDSDSAFQIEYGFDGLRVALGFGTPTKEALPESEMFDLVVTIGERIEAALGVASSTAVPVASAPTHG